MTHGTYCRAKADKHFYLEKIESEIQKSHDRWYGNVRLIHDIIKLEWPLTSLDLLCRFDKRELDSVTDILYWLVVDGDVPF
jgi:hypothetical protein